MCNLLRGKFGLPETITFNFKGGSVEGLNMMQYNVIKQGRLEGGIQIHHRGRGGVFREGLNTKSDHAILEQTLITIIIITIIIYGPNYDS